jgi:hypothetical protein
MGKIASVSFGQSARSLATKFAELPNRLQSGGMRRASTKAAKSVVNNAKPRIPVDKSRKASFPFRHANDHYRDYLSYKVKTYKGSVISVVGPKSGKIPHAHLVEDGTQQRSTKRTTQYRSVGTKRVATRRTYVTANGKTRSRKVYVNRSVKRSVGSFVDVRKAGISQNRGRMPAFRPLGKAFAAVKPIIKLLIRDEMRASISAAAKGGP